MIGRRVASFDEIERAGDYTGPHDGRVFFLFRECDDGSLEIRESIACGRDDPEGEYHHGYIWMRGTVGVMPEPCITCGHRSPHDVPPIQVCRDPRCGCDGPYDLPFPSPGVPTMNLLESCYGTGGPPRQSRPRFLHNASSHPLLWLWQRVGWWLHDRTEPD